MIMICETRTKQQFLVTWYHPVEARLDWDGDTWVTSRNDDFGYEVARALIVGDSEAAVKDAVCRRYDNPAINLVFRSCTPHPEVETFLQMAPKPGRGAPSRLASRDLLSA
jgi:hypothetical protein